MANHNNSLIRLFNGITNQQLMVQYKNPDSIKNKQQYLLGQIVDTTKREMLTEDDLKSIMKFF